jgi:hypothetical protein
MPAVGPVAHARYQGARSCRETPRTAPARGGETSHDADTVTDQLAEFLDRRAWRREANAAGLHEAAALVRGLPDDDSLPDRLDKLIQAAGPGRLRVPARR